MIRGVTHSCNTGTLTGTELVTVTRPLAVRRVTGGMEILSGGLCPTSSAGKVVTTARVHDLLDIAWNNCECRHFGHNRKVGKAFTNVDESPPTWAGKGNRLLPGHELGLLCPL